MKKNSLLLLPLLLMLPLTAHSGKNQRNRELENRVPLETLLKDSGRFSDEEQRVIQVIQHFEACYENLDALGLMRIWPTLDQNSLKKVESAFSGYKLQKIQLYDVDVLLSGSRAIFLGNIQVDVVTSTDHHKELNMNLSIKLRQTDGDWFIDSFFAASQLLQ